MSDSSESESEVNGDNGNRRRPQNDEAEEQQNAAKVPRKDYPTKVEIMRQMNAGEIDIQLPKKKTAKCWKTFGHPHVVGTDTVYRNYAVCKSCKSVYVYDSKKGNSQLNSHKCPKEPTVSEQQTKLTQSFFDKKSKLPAVTTLPAKTKAELNEKAVMTCAIDMRPLSIFERDGMLCFCQELVDTASTMGRFDVKTTLVTHSNLSRNYLNVIYKREKAEILKEMQQAESIAHTTDVWQDKYTGTNYISLTCFYINDEFRLRKIIWKTEKFNVPSKNAETTRNWYLDCIKEIGLDTKRHYVVADNASVMEAAFKNLNGVGCAPHCINLLVTAMTSSDLAPEAKELFIKAKSIVKHVKKASLQHHLPKRLCQSVSTRWNSSLKMLESIEKVWVELTQTLINRNDAAYLTGLSLGTIREVIDFLKHFRIASEILEADKEPTIHLVLYHYFKLEKLLAAHVDDPPIIKNMKIVGRSAIQTKWGKRLKPIHYAATLLDPRAKNSPKMSAEQRLEGKLFITELYQYLNSENERGDEIDNDLNDDELDFYGDGNQEGDNSIIELDAYLREPAAINVKTPEELLNYWRAKSTTSPGLAKVAKVILAVPASSATSERSFSDAGFTINVRRTMLKPENVDKLLFIRSFLRLPIFEGAEIGDDWIDDDDNIDDG